MRLRIWLLFGAWIIAAATLVFPYPNTLEIAWLFPAGFMGYLGDIPNNFMLWIACGWLAYFAVTISGLLVGKRVWYFLIYTILCSLLILNVIGCHLMEKFQIQDYPHKMQKVMDCTTNVLDFPITKSREVPYDLWLGIPSAQTNQLNFRGEIILRQNAGVVARFLINSDELQTCRWYADSHISPSNEWFGYMLTRARPNHLILSQLLVSNQTYNVRIIFDKLPPAQSSLWLESEMR